MVPPRASSRLVIVNREVQRLRLLASILISAIFVGPGEACFQCITAQLLLLASPATLTPSQVLVLRDFPIKLPTHKSLLSICFHGNPT